MSRIRSRVGVVVVAATAVGLGGLTGLPATAATGDTTPGAVTRAERPQSREAMAKILGFHTVPKTTAKKAKGAPVQPDPFLSETRAPWNADTARWRAEMKTKSAARDRAKAREAAARATTRAALEPLLVDEAEPDAVTGGNDTAANAQPIPQFGTRSGARPAARILGTLAEIPQGGTVEFDPIEEDNGSIPLAGESQLEQNAGSSTTGVIGDGPHGPDGDGSGDFDFYAIRDAEAGQLVTVDTDTPDSDLDGAVILWDAEGNVVDANDDDGESLDSFLQTTLPAAGDYFVSMQWFGNPPADPFDSGSGFGTVGDPSETGAYGISFALQDGDTDFYSVRLRAGDVLSGSVSGSAGRLTVLDPSRTEVFGSAQDATYIYPMASPLTGGGNAVVDHVAARAGTYYLGVSGGAGNYDVTLEAYRPGTETAKVTQKIFVDFDGARVNTGIFGGPGVRQLSPLSAFLGRWGIPASRQDAVIDRVLATLTENLSRDFSATGTKVEILNSRDDADPFGQPDVSRLIVGGTIEESGVDTIGIAQSIDPGNYETEETALILLDVLSGSVDDFGDATLNYYLTPESSRVRFVGTAIGNVASHEAGHYLGNWHVDQFNEVLNIMDQGGNFALLYGVGDDGVGGTADDPDVDFGVDVLNPNEGFSGLEDTAARTRWALGIRS